MNQAEKFKELRRKSGLSQQAFAEKYGVSWKTVQAWEYGVSSKDWVLRLITKAEASEQVQHEAFFLEEYRDSWGNGSCNPYKTREEAEEACWKKWEAMSDKERGSYLEDDAGRFWVYRAHCTWDEETDGWEPGEPEEEVLNMLG